jgi:hypothetical protein
MLLLRTGLWSKFLGLGLPKSKLYGRQDWFRSLHSGWSTDSQNHSPLRPSVIWVTSPRASRM